MILFPGKKRNMSETLANIQKGGRARWFGTPLFQRQLRCGVTVPQAWRGRRQTKRFAYTQTCKCVFSFLSNVGRLRKKDGCARCPCKTSGLYFSNSGFVVGWAASGMARMPAEHAVCLYADMHFFLFLANTYFVLQSSRKGHQATNAANGWTCPLIPVTDALEPLAWMPVDALQEHVPLALCLSRGKVFVYEN